MNNVPDNEVGLASNNDLPDPEESHALMELVLEHYIKHHQSVLKKLVHAQHATMQSIREIEELNKEIQADENLQEFQTVRKYDKMWGQIIELFENSGLSETELHKVEDMLTTIPKVIKKYYEMLVQNDKILMQLINELNSEKYKKAIKIVNKVQQRPNLMTGLGPEEYEEQDHRQGFIFRVPQFREANR